MLLSLRHVSAASSPTPPTPTIGGTDLTLSVWVKRALSGTSWDRLIDFGSGQPSNNIILSFYYGMNWDVYHGSTLQGRVETGGTFPANVWTHVAVVHSASSSGATTGPATIYWDGALKKSGVTSLPLAVARSGYYVGNSHWGVAALRIHRNTQIYTGTYTHIHRCTHTHIRTST